MRLLRAYNESLCSDPMCSAQLVRNIQRQLMWSERAEKANREHLCNPSEWNTARKAVVNAGLSQELRGVRSER